MWDYLPDSERDKKWLIRAYLFVERWVYLKPADLIEELVAKWEDWKKRKT